MFKALQWNHSTAARGSTWAWHLNVISMVYKSIYRPRKIVFFLFNVQSSKATESLACSRLSDSGEDLKVTGATETQKSTAKKFKSYLVNV